MKVFNLGSDYAYQQKQKSKETTPKGDIPKEEKPLNPQTNVEDKIQNGGGREMEISPKKVETPEPKSDIETESETEQVSEAPEKKKRSVKKQEQETD